MKNQSDVMKSFLLFTF